MTRECCGNCMFFVPEKKDRSSPRGECHRNSPLGHAFVGPPRQNPLDPNRLDVSVDTLGYWPRTGTGDWCGEYREAMVEPAEKGQA